MFTRFLLHLNIYVFHTVEWGGDGVKVWRDKDRDTDNGETEGIERTDMVKMELVRTVATARSKVTPYQRRSMAAVSRVSGET